MTPTDEREGTPSPGRAARGYAKFGWRVFPCRPRGKEPITPKGCLDATTDLDVIDAWWSETPDANVGVATGPESDLFVLDVDDVLVTQTLLDKIGAWDPTGMVITGSGGFHVYFRHFPDARNSTSRIIEGVDTRGPGGYVLAPPSIHPNGKPYRWDLRKRPIEAPSGLQEAFRQVERPTPPPRPPNAAEGVGDAAITGMIRHLGTVQKGNRNSALNWAAYRAGQIIAAGDAEQAGVYEALIEAGKAMGLSYPEVTKTVSSGWHSGMRVPMPASRRTFAPRTAFARGVL